MILPEKLQITWKKGEKTARRDCRIMNAWADYSISTEEAIELLSHNNETTITERQFLANAHLLGYKRY